MGIIGKYCVDCVSYHTKECSVGSIYQTVCDGLVMPCCLCEHLKYKRCSLSGEHKDRYRHSCEHFKKKINAR